MRLLEVALWAAAGAACAAAQAPGEETLDYAINWPSGLSLGEARLEAKRAGARWQFEFSIEAALPGFVVRDRYQSVAAAEGLCSLELEKQFVHGKRKGHEQTSFDLERAVGTRQTLEGGGKSELTLPACPKDALTFLYHLRRELSQGRLPPPQSVYFGAIYQVRVSYAGTQRLRVGEAALEADRLTAAVKGPASEVSVEVFFARDAARTLLLARVPFPMGIFTMELVR